jgi:hypothetical protein
MTHANPKVKDQIKDANSMNIGWYSPTAEELCGNIYVYQTPDGKGEMRLTSITKLNAQKPIWKDIVCKGEVGTYVRTIKSCSQSDTKNIDFNLTIKKLTRAGF